jgi:hypothetical protein
VAGGLAADPHGDGPVEVAVSGARLDDVDPPHPGSEANENNAIRTIEHLDQGRDDTCMA